MSDVTNGTGGWHLDKRVPIALIIAILGQALAFGWWAATQTAQLAAHGQRIDGLEKREDQDRAVSALVARDLGEIKGQLAILIQRMNRPGQ
jgi:hypothetical protein